MWADRITGSALAEQLVREERADLAGLERIADAWRAWADDPDGWIAIPHGELVIRVANPLVTPPGPAGLGLAGMRERVGLYGGALSAGVVNGRWVVEARLPVAVPVPAAP